MPSVIEIKKSYITLGQFLKKIHTVGSGGSSKDYLSLNRVLVNNVLENRRGRKLYSGDEIIINDNSYIIYQTK